MNIKKSTKKAKKLGISRQYLCDIEHGRRMVSPKKAFEYAKQLGYPAESFVLLAMQAELDTALLPFDVEISIKPKIVSNRKPLFKP
jgi:transcriptional regulator with XRE-family HTH domain